MCRSILDIQSATAEIRRGKKEETRMWANVMGALSNIGGALCSTPQSLADAQYLTVMQYRCQDAKPVEICWGAPKYEIDLSGWSTEVHHIISTCGGIAAYKAFSVCRYMP